jgi:phosphopantetheinyl transferase (holo-ACP synthase)
VIGNDIVDLQQARQESNWRRRRYVEKIFTQEEQQLIITAEAPDTMVWLLWSCKEAAYKRWASKSQERRFFPKKIEVKGFQRVQNNDLATAEADCQVVRHHYTSHVQIVDHCYTVHTRLVGDFIHSWTLPEGEKLLLCKVAPLCQPDLSAGTRSLLFGHLAPYFRWSPADISLQKNEHGRPFIYYQNKKCPLSLSLAHHGRYGGFVLAEG